MNKFVAVAIAAAAASGAAAVDINTCTQTQKCNVAVGTSCNTVAPIVSIDCNTDTGYCNKDTKVCTALPAAGTACGDSGFGPFYCADTAFCDTTAGNCVAKKGEGEACTSASQCSGSLFCLSGKCAAATGGSFTILSEGETGCTDATKFCVTGTSCISDTCTRDPGFGETCPTDLSASCTDGSTCTADNKCTARYSVAAGGSCETKSGGTSSSLCALGNYCDSTTKKCAAVNSATNANCNVTTSFANCGSQESCYCPTYAGQAKCKYSTWSYMASLTSDCSDELGKLTSCVSDNPLGGCDDEINALSCCGQTKWRSVVGSWRYDEGGANREVCSSISACDAAGSASSVAASFAVVAAAVAAALL